VCFTLGRLNSTSLPLNGPPRTFTRVPPLFKNYSQLLPDIGPASGSIPSIRSRSTSAKMPDMSVKMIRKLNARLVISKSITDNDILYGFHI